ncbi:MAG: FliA/WhiG family RNA polymerase sigma factor [Planctomycetia bacterium]|nr:FliA/WhiG family RNA polymerase sigma factor [Planctomycetia bacterium]
MEKLRSAVVRENMDAVWEEFSRNPSDIRLRNRLVERYMHIVKHHAERIHAKLPGEIELDDIISAGTFGLIEAVQAFQLDRGVKFETFCVTRIRGAMLDELRSMDWVPRMVRSKASKLNEAYKVLEGKFGRKPSEEELSRFLDVPLDEVKKTITDSCRVNLTSLDKNWSDQSGEGDVSELDLIPDRKSEDPTERLEKTELIRACTKGLTKNERLIIILYYFEEMTMKEIGATLDLSESRVSQMHSSIVERIKALHNNRRFDI